MAKLGCLARSFLFICVLSTLTLYTLWHMFKSGVQTKKLHTSNRDQNAALHVMHFNQKGDAGGKSNGTGTQTLAPPKNPGVATGEGRAMTPGKPKPVTVGPRQKTLAQQLPNKTSVETGAGRVTTPGKPKPVTVGPRQKTLAQQLPNKTSVATGAGRATTLGKLKPVTVDPRQKTFEKERQRFLRIVGGHMTKVSSDKEYTKALESVIDRAKERTLDGQSNEKESLLDSQFLRYMKCPTSVRRKMLTNPLTSRKLVLETPILAWKAHYNPEEYRRLSNFHGIFGWDNVNETDVSAALTGLKSVRNKYMFDDRMANEAVPDDTACIRCAVVGNGGILNGSKMGKEIDGNDYVFRVNTAKTKGHEADVGSRTSFYCFGIITLSNTLAGSYSTKFRMPPNDEGIRYVFFADSPWVYTYLGSVLHGGKGVSYGRRYPVRFPKTLQAKDVKLVHPDFERYLKWSWVNSTEQQKRVHRPTTGGIMLLLALHTCDEVNVYGYGGSYKKFSEHYYDKDYHRHVNYANHDNSAENTLWHKLHDQGIINLYKRD